MRERETAAEVGSYFGSTVEGTVVPAESQRVSEPTIGHKCTSEGIGVGVV